MTITLEQAQADLGRCIDLVVAGQEIGVTRDGKVVVWIVPYVEHPKGGRPDRVAGSAKGEIWMAPDFDAPLDEFKEYM